jgi:Icc-related predicted phosphoesterase
MKKKKYIINYTDSKPNKLRLCHCADLHGFHSKLYGRFSCIVLSGDWFDNSKTVGNGNKTQEMVFQLNWLNNNINNIKQWTQGLPLFFILGNHDFLHPDLVEQTLRKEGIDATSLHEKIITHKEYNFYGFPYVPSMGTMWNYERSIPEMEVEVDKLVNALNKTHIDVLVMHSPLYGILDLNYGNENIGSSVILNALLYKVKPSMLPRYVLTGHVHENAGTAIKNNMLISNAATIQTIIEILP